MDKIGIILIVIGVLTLFIGLGMDTTRTASNCVTYESSFGDGYSCVEYQYQNPFGKIALITFGLSMALLGGGKMIYSNSKNLNQNRLSFDDNKGESSSHSDTGTQSFADSLEENKKD